MDDVFYSLNTTMLYSVSKRQNTMQVMDMIVAEETRNRNTTKKERKKKRKEQKKTIFISFVLPFVLLSVKIKE